VIKILDSDLLLMTAVGLVWPGFDGGSMRSCTYQAVRCHHRGNITTWRKVRSNTDVASTAFGKEEIAVHL
jgi:hypothetical protein